MKLLPVFAAGGLGVFASLGHPQTIYAFDGATATVRELSGPPAGPCQYPDGPVASSFLTNVPFGCPLPGPVPPGEHRGDVAVDRFHDTIWVTDGFHVAEYTPGGLPINAFTVPSGLFTGPVLGLGFDTQLQTLWMTDGVRAAELRAPATRCTTPQVVTPPFLLPGLGGALNTVTDIDFDPLTTSLWICDAAGFVGQVTVSPPGSLGPLGAYQAAPGPCGLATNLTGVTVDVSSPAVGTVYVTDGSKMAYLLPSGALAAPTFATPLNCFPIPGERNLGIGYSSRPVTYGAGGGVLPPPKLGTIGEALLGTTNLQITVSGAQPGGIAFLPFSLHELCPALTVSTVPVLILPPGFGFVLATVTSGTGFGAVTVPIPAAVSLGLEFQYQWFVFGVPGPGGGGDGPPILSSGAGSMRPGYR